MTCCKERMFDQCRKKRFFCKKKLLLGSMHLDKGNMSLFSKKIVTAICTHTHKEKNVKKKRKKSLKCNDNGYEQRQKKAYKRLSLLFVPRKIKGRYKVFF